MEKEKKRKIRIVKKLGFITASALGGMYIVRKAIDYASDWITYNLIKDKYEENLWMLASSVQRVGMNRLIQTELRSRTDSFIERPIGGTNSYNYISKILFNITQLDKLPTIREKNIDTSVIIGPRAKKPLKLKIPILIAGMGYGVALSEAYKIAFAKGATAVGTATNTGLGPWLEKERKEAKYLILQYSRISWNKKVKYFKQCDAVEIQFGQGANAGVGKTLKANDMSNILRNRLGLKPGQDAVIHNRIDGVEKSEDLALLIERLRRVTAGVPIGVKIGAGKYLEADLKIIINAGADFVSVDGAEGGTHGSLPVFEDDFGVPTVIAAARAAKFWEQNDLKGKVSLLVGGGLITPGDCLKMLALGADAVYLGTAVLFATTHTQVLKVVPFEPPTQLAWESGKYKNKFDINKGAKSLARFLHATVYEMEEAVKALGKTSTREVSKDDLFTIDKDVAEITGVELGFKAPVKR